MEYKQKISFDFDDTLSKPSVQRFVYALVKEGHDVHIVTSRMSNERAGNSSWNDDLYIVADSVGIPEENIHFCNLSPKDKFFKRNTEFLFHLDDDPDEVGIINLNTDTKGVLFVETFDNKVIKDLIKLITKQ